MSPADREEGRAKAMTWRPKRGKWDWRRYLTAEEAAFILEADGEIARLKAEMRRWTQPRGPIVNRAIQRAKYEAVSR